MRAKLTVLIACRNERLNIAACIAAARKVADEILVADSGSTDETRDIVRQIGDCRLIDREFVNYADFKNWAIPQASHPWVFVVDADEIVTDELAREIDAALANVPDHLDGYYVPRKTFFLGHEMRHCGLGADQVFRLFRRDRCRYQPCRVHESIPVASSRAGRLRQSLLHHTNWTYDQYFAKYVNYTRWGAQDKWDHGARSGPWGLIVRPWVRFFQLYWLRLGFLDGMPGLQYCTLQSFFVTFVKQARLWEMEHARRQPPADSQPGPDSRPAALSQPHSTENWSDASARRKLAA